MVRVAQLGSFTTAPVSTDASVSRPTLSLDGPWEFVLDPNRQGWSAGWSSGMIALPHRCIVPGAWEAQGYGNETDHLWSSYQPNNDTLASLFPNVGLMDIPVGGLAWYRRVVALPAATAAAVGSPRGLFLRVGGVHRSVTAFANGIRLGEHTGYLDELEWNVTAAATGKTSLAIVLAVDSFHNMTRDPLMGSFDMGEMEELNGMGGPPGAAGPWGGIWGHVKLESRHSIWLSNIFARANNSTVIASATVVGDSTVANSVRLDVTDCSTGEVVASKRVTLLDALNAALDTLTVTVTLGQESVKMWSPQSPALFNATLTLLDQSDNLTDAAAVDSLWTRFGIKDLKIVGHQFELNGQKLYLTGFGMDAPYADTIAAPSDMHYHLRQLRLAKSYGFNFIRCHSHFLPPEFYDACDEVGLFVSPELPIVYGNFFTSTVKLGEQSA